MHHVEAGAYVVLAIDFNYQRTLAENAVECEIRPNTDTGVKAQLRARAREIRWTLEEEEEPDAGDIDDNEIVNSSRHT